LDPPPPAPVAEGDVAVAEDVAQAENPITADISAAAMIHRLLLFERNRCTADLRAATVSWGLVGSSFMKQSVAAVHLRFM
jgi:hypothetical protein